MIQSPSNSSSLSLPQFSLGNWSAILSIDIPAQPHPLASATPTLTTDTSSQPVEELVLLYGTVLAVIVLACVAVVMVILLLKYMQIRRRDTDKGMNTHTHTHTHTNTQQCCVSVTIVTDHRLHQKEQFQRKRYVRPHIT